MIALEIELFIHVSVESIALIAVLFSFIKNRDFYSGMLSLFLFVGACVDISTLFFVSPSIARYVVMTYCLFEAYYFLVLIGSFHPKLKKHYPWILAAITGWWIYTGFFCGELSAIEVGYHSWFDALYEGGTAFFTAYTLLKLTEQNQEKTSEFAFWMLITLFFYTFSIFYIHNFIGFAIATKIWFVSNLIDSIALISYTFAGVQWFRKGSNWQLMS